MNQTIRDFLEDRGNHLSSVCLDILSEYCYKQNQSLSGAILSWLLSLEQKAKQYFKPSEPRNEQSENL